jgi:uncharacterized protein YjiS (DUF1127 family)
MSKHHTQEWALFSLEIAGGEGRRQQSGSSTSTGGWLRAPLFWIERSHQRRRLGELADLNNYLLRDIGVSRDEALSESAKPFWR